MNILRFITAGNVDDGKSTLIGRLLYETDSLFDDQIENIERVGRRNGSGDIDLSIVTDGLKSEREQGITIDVAYKYFSTDKRKFIVADAPGHLEYTRNMITGASNTDLAVILVDATKGITEQTIRHTYLVSLLNIGHIVVCVNKMDAVGYDQAVFEKIQEEYSARMSSILTGEVHFIPVSALKGDNVVNAKDNLDWYFGPTFLELLETIEPSATKPQKLRLPVQLVLRDALTPEGNRSYAGRVYGDGLSISTTVKVLPSGSVTRIKVLSAGTENVTSVSDGQSIVFETTEDVDISRGSLLIPADDEISSGRELQATVCWMDNTAAVLGKIYLLQIHASRTQVKLSAIRSVVDLHTLEEKEVASLQKNDIGKVVLRSATTISYDSFAESKVTGSAILIDPQSNSTAAMVLFG